MGRCRSSYLIVQFAIPTRRHVHHNHIPKTTPQQQINQINHDIFYLTHQPPSLHETPPGTYNTLLMGA